mgnify:CR=1 FL=1
MSLNLLKRGASRQDRCGKFRLVIGLRGIWKNFELYPRGKYAIFEPPLTLPLLLGPNSEEILRKYEGDMKEV